MTAGLKALSGTEDDDCMTEEYADDDCRSKDRTKRTMTAGLKTD